MRFRLLWPLLMCGLICGCVTNTFTRLTPTLQPRNANNVYPVETMFNSNLQSMRRDSIQAFVLVNGQPYPLRPEPIVQNRWEGYIPVGPNEDSVEYRFKFSYLRNTFGADPVPDSQVSPPFTLKIVGQ